MKIECTIRRDVSIRLENDTIQRTIGTKVSFDGDDGAVVYDFKPSSTDERHIAEVGNIEHAKRLLSISEAYAPADDESRKLAAVVVTKKPEDDFVDPAISGKKYTQESLEAMKYKEVKKLAQERYGIELAADAKHADYVFAILNAQGV